MSTEVLLPKLGFSMDEGTVQEWLVADGGEAREGEPLFVLESEKSAQEIEAPASGVLKIVVPAGENCKVGTVLATIG
jgi:pyruvate/2-oxoglutarate dehydrogenase complex dihydrolipoamide acyltransferase (E2) component